MYGVVSFSFWPPKQANGCPLQRRNSWKKNWIRYFVPHRPVSLLFRQHTTLLSHPFTKNASAARCCKRQRRNEDPHLKTSCTVLLLEIPMIKEAVKKALNAFNDLLKRSFSLEATTDFWCFVFLFSLPSFRWTDTKVWNTVSGDPISEWRAVCGRRIEVMTKRRRRKKGRRSKKFCWKNVPPNFHLPKTKSRVKPRLCCQGLADHNWSQCQ